MPHQLSEITSRLLTAARSAGASDADAIVIKNNSTTINVRGGTLEHAERSQSMAIGLRVLVGNRQACVSASDTSQSTIFKISEQAVATAKEAPIDPYCGIPNSHQLTCKWDLDALELADPSEEPPQTDLQDDALSCEAAATEIKGVSQVESASSSYAVTEIYLAATNGFSGGYRRTNRSTSCVAISGTGTEMEKDYDSDNRLFQCDLRDPVEIGRTAGERAVARVGGKKPLTGNFPILFDERISNSIIQHFLSATNGQSIAIGASWLRDSMHKNVLPDTLSIIEDPHRPRTFNSRPFDAEGLPTFRRTIVENGILRGWTLDCATAKRLGLTSTSNATRTIASPPAPSNWNIELTSGQSSQTELLRDMGTGLLVTSLIGATINPITGNYSRGASGFWVTNGTISHPVNECTIAGNLPDMLRRIIPANDAQKYLSIVVPSLLIEGMTIAGQ
ncbi:MAG: TldD/PmbA family protein [Aestuariivita sp.]|nr:TldD/PmbA family protein [Aestuariivita sp.]